MNVNTVYLVMSLMNNMDISPLEAVWSVGDVDDQDRVIEVNEGE